MRKLKRAIIKEEILAITGDYISAIILHQFIYWSERIEDFDIFIREEKERMMKENISTNFEELNGWIYKSAEQLSQETMLGLSPSNMRKYIKQLIDQGFLSERTNPKFKWDRTKQYRVNLYEIVKKLNEKGYELEGYVKSPESNEIENAFYDLENQKSQNEKAIPKNIIENTLINNKYILKEKENIIKEKENPIFEQKEVKFEIVKSEEPITITDEEQIFNYWNSKEIVKHRELTKPLKDEIKKKIKELGFDNIILGIDHYAEILQDKKYFFNYAWSLIDFLKRKNGITNFLEEGSQWQSYVKQSSKYKNKRDEEALENWAKKDYQGTTLF